MEADPVPVVGDSMLDRHWDGPVERISPEAPAPVLRLAGEWQRPGGAANVAVNLAGLRCRTALATLLGDDEAGALFSAGGLAPLHVAAEPREVYDVSGTGDTVLAALASGLAAGDTLPDAVRLANRAAGIVVGKFGTASVSPAELQRGEGGAGTAGTA